MWNGFRSGEDGNRDFGTRAGGTREISRWCNHRTTPTNHEPRPGTAREGHAGSGWHHRQETFARFSRPCRGASRIGGGDAARFRWFHHRLISVEPPARSARSKPVCASLNQIDTNHRRAIDEIAIKSPFNSNRPVTRHFAYNISASGIRNGFQKLADVAVLRCACQKLARQLMRRKTSFFG
jgi:hypothetical protein